MTNAQRIKENTGKSLAWIKEHGYMAVRLKVDSMGNYVSDDGSLFAQEGMPLWYDMDAAIKEGMVPEAYDTLHKGWEMDVALPGDVYEAWLGFHV